MSNVVPFPSPARPSLRRPRRADVVTYRVRVAVEGTVEPLWRRLELASDMFLDDVHAVIQVAMGWTDSHLHRFASGPAYYSRDSEFYLMPFEIEEGEQGEPEHTVRLDEVLAEPGDVLFYCYDFGDDWQHVIRLEEVSSRPGPAPRAVCVGGEGPSPAEDCGGVHGYDLLVAANDPAHPRYAVARVEYAEIFGDDVDPAWAAPTPFDEDAVNRALGRLALDAPAVSQLPARLAQLHEAIRFTPAQRALRQLLGDARLDEPTETTSDGAARMVGRYTWLLNRVGDDGIPLTSAGYLPPVHVKAAVTELGIGDEWIGKGNREVQTLPVLDLRESAQRAGLVRKHKGHLSRTARGRKLARDPVGLWRHLAERVPPGSRDVSATQAGLLLVVAVAAGVEDHYELVAEFLGAIGWQLSDGRPMTGASAAHAAADTNAVLRALGGYERDPADRWRYRPSAGGVTFARAALQARA